MLCSTRRTFPFLKMLSRFSPRGWPFIAQFPGMTFKGPSRRLLVARGAQVSLLSIAEYHKEPSELTQTYCFVRHFQFTLRGTIAQLSLVTRVKLSNTEAFRRDSSFGEEALKRQPLLFTGRRSFLRCASYSTQGLRPF